MPPSIGYIANAVARLTQADPPPPTDPSIHRPIEPSRHDPDTTRHEQGVTELDSAFFQVADECGLPHERVAEVLGEIREGGRFDPQTILENARQLLTPEEIQDRFRQYLMEHPEARDLWARQQSGHLWDAGKTAFPQLGASIVGMLGFEKLADILHIENPSARFAFVVGGTHIAHPLINKILADPVTALVNAGERALRQSMGKFVLQVQQGSSGTAVITRDASIRAAWKFASAETAEAGVTRAQKLFRSVGRVAGETGEAVLNVTKMGPDIALGDFIDGTVGNLLTWANAVFSSAPAGEQFFGANSKARGYFHLVATLGGRPLIDWATKGAVSSWLRSASGETFFPTPAPQTPTAMAREAVLGEIALTRDTLSFWDLTKLTRGANVFTLYGMYEGLKLGLELGSSAYFGAVGWGNGGALANEANRIMDARMPLPTGSNWLSPITPTSPRAFFSLFMSESPDSTSDHWALRAANFLPETARGGVRWLLDRDDDLLVWAGQRAPEETTAAIRTLIRSQDSAAIESGVDALRARFRKALVAEAGTNGRIDWTTRAKNHWFTQFQLAEAALRNTDLVGTLRNLYQVRHHAAAADFLKFFNEKIVRSAPGSTVDKKIPLLADGERAHFLAWVMGTSDDAQAIALITQERQQLLTRALIASQTDVVSAQWQAQMWSQQLPDEVQLATKIATAGAKLILQAELQLRFFQSIARESGDPLTIDGSITPTTDYFSTLATYTRDIMSSGSAAQQDALRKWALQQHDRLLTEPAMDQPTRDRILTELQVMNPALLFGAHSLRAMQVAHTIRTLRTTQRPLLPTATAALQESATAFAALAQEIIASDIAVDTASTVGLNPFTLRAAAEQTQAALQIEATRVQLESELAQLHALKNLGNGFAWTQAYQNGGAVCGAAFLDIACDQSRDIDGEMRTKESALAALSQPTQRPSLRMAAQWLQRAAEFGRLAQDSGGNSGLPAALDLATGLPRDAKTLAQFADPTLTALDHQNEMLRVQTRTPGVVYAPGRATPEFQKIKMAQYHANTAALGNIFANWWADAIDDGKTMTDARALIIQHLAGPEGVGAQRLMQQQIIIERQAEFDWEAIGSSYHATDLFDGHGRITNFVLLEQWITHDTSTNQTAPFLTQVLNERAQAANTKPDVAGLSSDEQTMTSTQLVADAQRTLADASATPTARADALLTVTTLRTEALSQTDNMNFDAAAAALTEIPQLRAMMAQCRALVDQLPTPGHRGLLLNDVEARLNTVEPQIAALNKLAHDIITIAASTTSARRHIGTSPQSPLPQWQHGFHHFTNTPPTSDTAPVSCGTHHTP